MTSCECSIPNGGFCPVHQVDKCKTWVALCRTRPDYRQKWDEGRGPGQRPSADGKESPARKVRVRTGDELTKIIAWWQRRFPWFDLKERSGCRCHETATWMNSLGPDGCEKNIEKILDRFEAEAKKRKLTIPFQRTWARMMVKRAIRRARKNTRLRDG